MNFIKKIVDYFLSRIILIIVTCLLICVIWQVIARWFGINSTYTDEIARFLFIWSGLFGASLAHGQGRHLAIDLLTSKLTNKSKKFSDILISILVIVFAFTVMVYGGGKAMLNTQGQISAVMGIPVWMIYLAIPLNGLFIIFYSTNDLIKLFHNQKIDHNPAELC